MSALDPRLLIGVGVAVVITIIVVVLLVVLLGSDTDADKATKTPGADEVTAATTNPQPGLVTITPSPSS